MHLYNAWLPPPVAAETWREKESFSSVVRSIKETWNVEDPDSVFSTLKWISIIDTFIKAKSEVSLEDVDALVVAGLEIFQASQNKLYVQVRWGGILTRLLKKYGKKLSVKLQWRPFYDILLTTHFRRTTGPEGWKLKQQHFVCLTCLVQCCRKFFPSGSAYEIWNEFRPLLENPWHNSSLEGSGFVKLFLPMNQENEEFFTNNWIKQCIDLWDSVPNCRFWDVQWASVTARCIKNYKSLDWECFLPTLFTKFLNMFEVPVASGNAAYPFSLEVPKNIRFLFSSSTSVLAKATAKSIVHLLKPGSLAQEHFAKLADLLEQFYHPSNGGHWTYSLELFLRYLVRAFQRRLQKEQLCTSDTKQAELNLGRSERVSFVKVVLKLIDRGQYSKTKSLAETVAVAMSILSYIEPSLMLPFIISRFHLALETDTATHQLKTAITSISFAARAFCFSSVSPSNEGDGSQDAFIDLLTTSILNALLGIDANDPPKTLATMQLIGSIFSNLPLLSDDNQPAILQSINFSEWLDEFFSRIFSLLLHLEPRSVLNEGAQITSASGTFLVEGNPYFFCLLEVLLGKLSKPLFMQALKRISNFVNTNVLPGAITEVGLICCACVHANPKEAAHHLIEPILTSLISSLKESPISGYGGKGIPAGSSFLSKAALSPALETALEFHLKILAVAITYAGPILLPHRDELKEAIASAFEAPSWKVNVAGDHLLRSLLGSLVLYYPFDQYKCFKQHPSTAALEEWVRSKTDIEDIQLRPIWHVPSEDELLFANELIDLHFCSALADLVRIFQTKLHSEAGNEKDHFKVTMLRIFSSLQGVLSCLPDLCPSFKAGKTSDDYFLIAGATGALIGSRELRENAAHDIHLACKYLLDERSDDSILLLLVIQIINALVNVGSLEIEEVSDHLQACKLESAATIEPSCNFINSVHSEGKKRPRWALIDKVYMQNTWRSSQSLYHKFRTDSDLSPPDALISLTDDLLLLSLHRYEMVRSVACSSLLKILNRWHSLITKCILALMDKLHDSSTEEHVVLGSCAILASEILLHHLTKDIKAFSSFILGLLASAHHKSLKAQKAITELFIKYNIHFSGLPRSFYRVSSIHPDGPEFSDLVSKISSMSINSSSLHWRYNLMANRILLLLILSSRNNSKLPSEILGEITGHYLRNLRSELPQLRILAISALNSLLSGSHDKLTGWDQQQRSDLSKDYAISGSLDKIFQEEGFFNETLNSLSHAHIIADSEGASIKGNLRTSVQSVADKAITFFYFDFYALWPRTPTCISLLGGEMFIPNVARIFKRLVQECGPSVISSLQSTLEEFSSAKERSKQCVAAEALAGIMHSDINGLLEAWESWIVVLMKKIIVSSSVESVPDWAACIRYAVTGKGKYGTRIPLLRCRILDCLLSPLPETLGTNIVAKRYTFLLAAFIEISPTRMSTQELDYHMKFMEELLENISHSSAQVREAIGVVLSVLSSNLRCFTSYADGERCVIHSPESESWAQHLTGKASELAANIQNSNHFARSEIPSDLTDGGCIPNNELREDVNRMETMLHFLISSLKSGRSLFLLDIITGFLNPVFSLQETSHKDLSMLAKAAFELLKWRILPRPHLEKSISLLSSLISNPNWRTRFTSLSYLRAFMYRHTFILSGAEKSEIWKFVMELLVDNQVEVREHAAGVLASLVKGGDEDVSSSYRNQAYAEALAIHKRQKLRNWKSSKSVASIHGVVLALAASVLSVPYDMPSWLPDHVALLARFISEPSPVKATVTKAVAEFKRTHADTWTIQKHSFTVEQLEVLADTSSSSSYFA